MKRSLVGWLAAIVLAVGGAAFAYVFWFAGGSGEPTTELTTPQFANTTQPTDLLGSSSTTSPIDATAGETTAVAFVIDQTLSSARFEIDEVLNGSPKHVVGTTDQVVGQVLVDPGNLASIEVSEIVVNARTLTTDSERRDRAMRGPIVLDSGSDEHELITLTTASVDGLAGDADIGATIEFTSTGDLTIKGIIQSVTFDVSATMVDESTSEGLAIAEVTRDMFEIGIPSVPNVADVTTEVVIALEFVAVAG